MSNKIRTTGKMWFSIPMLAVVAMFAGPAMWLLLAGGWINTSAPAPMAAQNAQAVSPASPLAPACPPPSNGSNGAFSPTVNTFLPPGIYNYTTINIPAGVQVTTNGTGILDLRASGNVTIAGTINLSGGNGAGASSSTGCGGGATGFSQPVGCGGSGGAGGTGGTGSPGASGTDPDSGDGGVFGGGGGGNGGGGGGGYAGGGGAGGPGTVSGGPGGGAGGGNGGNSDDGGGGGYGGGPTYNGGFGGNSGDGAGGGGGSIGSDAAADLEMASTFRPGSGGGGGGGDLEVFSTYGGGGGGGGGALRIASSTQISVTGALRADGGNGGPDNGGGGGGSGGAIFLAAPSVQLVTGAAVTARGGLGGAAIGGGALGGIGGPGRILIAANSIITGGASFNPPLPPGSNGAGYTYLTSYCLNTPTPLPTNTFTPTGTPTSTATATPTQVVIVVGHVNWQGRAAQPSAAQQLPITLTLKSGSTEVNYPLMLTDPSGFFTVTTTLPNGSYNWRAKGPMFLANTGNLTLAGASPVNVEMGLMRTGDLNGDNVVNTVDFNALKNNFGTGGAPPADPGGP